MMRDGLEKNESLNRKITYQRSMKSFQILQYNAIPHIKVLYYYMQYPKTHTCKKNHRAFICKRFYIKKLLSKIYTYKYIVRSVLEISLKAQPSTRRYHAVSIPLLVSNFSDFFQLYVYAFNTYKNVTKVNLFRFIFFIRVVVESDKLSSCF